MDRALFAVWPRLASALPWLELGELPTPVQAMTPLARELGSSAELYAKRDDLTSSLYGGNKVRTLELLFADARARGAQRVYATGAFGSNHATATVLHAPRVGFESGVVLFTQPVSRTAADNLSVSLARATDRVVLPHWSTLPFGMLAARRRSTRAARTCYVMVPGGATPLGALGYVSAAFELAQQVASGQLPAPDTIFVGVGSTCTSAGLLVGLHHAARLGIGFKRPPRLVSVRVSPWPVTARFRVLGLAARTARLLGALVSEPERAPSARLLGAAFEIDPGFLGSGYGRPSPEGREAMQHFERAGLPGLDTTYSAKSAAAVLAALRAGHGAPILYWATKSSAALPLVTEPELEGMPARARRFLAQASACR